jgi:hypothetical protein
MIAWFPPRDIPTTRISLSFTKLVISDRRYPAYPHSIERAVSNVRGRRTDTKR